MSPHPTACALSTSSARSNYFCGIDGCRGGWHVTVIDAANRLISQAVFTSFSEVLSASSTASLTLVDIPIGLPDQEHPQRKVEPLLRRLLKGRTSCVFNVPVRAAIHAPTTQASLINHVLTGKKLSCQSIHLCPKIAEVDLLLRSQPTLQQRLCETHPELCFAALNNHIPLAPKKSQIGQAHRLQLLQPYFPFDCLSEQLAQQKQIFGSKVQRDDILDSLVCAVAARLIAQGQRAPFPLRLMWMPMACAWKSYIPASTPVRISHPQVAIKRASRNAREARISMATPAGFEPATF